MTFDWLYKTKIWWKSNLFYGYRQLHCLCKTDDICKDIAEDVKGRFDTSNFELDRPLSKIKNKKGIRSMKVELDGERMKKFVGLTAKTYSYLIENNDEDKKAKSTKKCIIKRRLEIQDYKNSLEVAQI